MNEINHSEKLLDSGNSQRILQLDGLRGLAVLFVIAFHYINNQLGSGDTTKLGKAEYLLMKATYFGWAGVDLFFVLSGFLIGTILLTNRGSAHYFKTFYIRRFFRIVPIYYLLLFIFLIAKRTDLYATDIYIFQNDIPLYYYFPFMQNFAMGQVGNFGPEALTPTWSLAVEEQFYLIIPLVVYGLKPSHLKYFIVFCLLLAPLSRLLAGNWYQKYTLLPSRIDSPIMGFLVAYLLNDQVIELWIIKNIRTVKITAFGLLGTSILIYIFSDIGVFNHTVIALIFGLILLIVLNTHSGLLFKILTLKAFVFTGTISYFLYLFHQLVNGLFHLTILNEKVPLLENSSDLGVTLLSFITTILMAVVSYRYLESPLVKYSHRYKYT
jgi:peptidoglycan/LPS O-acetylase OafA/YrhL